MQEKKFYITSVFKLYESLENKITWYHLVAFMILLPFDRFYTQLVLLSLLLHVVIHLDRSRLRSLFTFKNLVLSSVLLVGLAGVIYTPDINQAWQDLQRQSAILLFPIIFSCFRLNIGQYRTSILTFFGFTCVAVVLYLYADAIRIILYHKLPLNALFSQAFLNHNFSEPLDLHATYLSMYAALSVAVFSYFFLKEKRNRYRLVYTVAISILLAGLVQLASRSVLLATVIFIVVGFPLLLFTGIQRLKFILVAIVVLAVALIGIIKIDSFKKRYVSELKNDLTQASINNEILEPRILRWKHALRLIKEAPVIGYGSGSERRLLKEKYFKARLYNSYLNEFNAHNQYLSIALKTGIAGLIIFLLTLLYGFILAWANRNIVFMAFMIIISIVSFSENILDVNKGIFFYAFFFSFFGWSSKPFDFLHRLKAGNS